MEDFKIRLKPARINAGLSQDDAAERIGCTRRTLWNWENGKSKPDFDYLKNICETYHALFVKVVVSIFLNFFLILPSVNYAVRAS